MTSPIVGPIPPYSNPPIQPYYYAPSRFFVSSIATGQPTCLVTTTVNHNYVIGQQVRLLIPPYSGCRQLNGRQGQVISIPAANQVYLDISTLNIDAFRTSPTGSQPQIIAIGDNNSGLISTSGRIQKSTTIPGSFINISP